MSLDFAREKAYNVVTICFTRHVMIANYHTHTFLCRHATGDIEQYVKTAVKNGLQILGFSDHAPFEFPNNYVSGCRMLPEQADCYFDTLLSLKEKYKNYLDIKIGFEIEYYPLLWDKTIERYRNFPLDYLILGNHFLGNEHIEQKPITQKTENGCDLKQYVDECITAMNTGRISYLCHPDMINYAENDELYTYEMSRLIAEAMRLDIPLELNLLGMRTHRKYPRDYFWELVGKMGATAILGCDAHAPEDVAESSNIENALRYAERFDVKLTELAKLKNPIF